MEEQTVADTKAIQLIDTTKNSKKQTENDNNNNNNNNNNNENKLYVYRNNSNDYFSRATNIK